jgi:hypothetical protein
MGALRNGQRGATVRSGTKLRATLWAILQRVGSSGSGIEREAFASLDDALLAHFHPAALVVTKQLRVVDARGDLESLQIRAIIGRAWRGPVADRVREMVKTSNGSGAYEHLKITILPLASVGSERLYCVVLESRAADRELESTRESLAALLVDSETSTEELRSAVEELRTANDELRATKDELTSANQEVARLNARLERRAKELERANTDLTELIDSLRMAIVVLGPDLRLTRFTPLAERVLALRPSHVGKPIGELESLARLKMDCAVVLSTQAPRFRELQVRPGRTLQVVIRPLVSEHQANAVLLAVMPGASKP